MNERTNGYWRGREMDSMALNEYQRQRQLCIYTYGARETTRKERKGGKVGEPRGHSARIAQKLLNLIRLRRIAVQERG